MKPLSAIQSTNNYGLFVSHPYQQAMSRHHVAKLAESMKLNGFDPAKPVIVFKEGNKLHIIDGHHRVAAAKETGVFVYYVGVDKDQSERIGQWNETVRKWQTMSFICYYANAKDNEDYKKILGYCGHGIPLEQVIALLSGSIKSGVTMALVRKGEFKIKTVKTIESILSIFDQVQDECPLIKSQHYVQALSALHLVNYFDPNVFVKKLQIQPRSITKCATRAQALEAIEEIYNHLARVKHPIAHDAQQQLDARNRGIKKARS